VAGPCTRQIVTAVAVTIVVMLAVFAAAWWGFHVGGGESREPVRDQVTTTAR
jgi:hypothetical protein